MTLQNDPKLAHSLQRFSSILSQEDKQRLLDIQEADLPTGIRINPLKGSPVETIKNLSERYTWQVEKISFCEHGWTIKDAKISPGGTIEHRMGAYYLQDAASMIPVSLFDMVPSQSLILDMAASPGGKTTHLVDRSGDRGLIVANDASRSRIPALRSVLETWGGINQIITQYPGESFGRWFPEKFDFVLLDAPCSMENLRPTPNHPLRETTIDERLRLQERQNLLLKSGLQALKIGGQLVYATCSLAPEEDEAVINTLLTQFPKAVEVLDVTHKFKFKASGLTSFDGETYRPELEKTLRLWPHITGMSGFFCALITKKQSIETEQNPPPERDFSGTHLKKVPDPVKRQITDQIEQNYGFVLERVLEQFSSGLFQRFEQLFLIPQHYLDNFKGLPYEFIGMPLGQWTGDILIPSHAFISRFGAQFSYGRLKLNDREVPIWIKGRDIRHPETDLIPKGQYLMITDSHGRNLGMGKFLPKRLRNMLPRGSI
jgi:16S rRNA (cytosine1407-C5)-methyltransferase